MRKEIIINGQSLPVREYEGRRVVTIMDVAQAHKVKAKRIQNNFKNNKKHFIEGMDYLHLKGKKATLNFMTGSKNTTQLNIFTESGYLMLVKSLTDDLAWKVQRELVNGYFRAKQVIKRERISKPVMVLNMFPLMHEEYKKLLYYRLEKQLSQEETALLMKIGRTRLFHMEANLKNAGLEIPKSTNNGNKYQLHSYKSVMQLKLTEV